MRVDRIEPINTKHPILNLANMMFNPPPLGAEVSLLSLAVVHMLCLYAYPSLPPEGYAKFTIGFDLENPYVTIIVGYSIQLCGDNGKLLLMSTVYGDIVSTLSELSRKYEESGIVRITLRVYSMDEKVVGVTPSTEDIVPLLEEVICMGFPINSAKPICADDIRHNERSYGPPI